VSRLLRDATLNEIEFEVWIACWDTHALFERLESDWKNRHRDEIEEREQAEIKAREIAEERLARKGKLPLPD
jgi:hypothetical protein